MHREPIIKLLGIKDLHVDVWDSGEDDNGLWFELHTAVRQQIRPQCRKKTKRVHGYRWQVIQSSRVGGQPVTLHL
ncbi:transposase family protein [Alteribacillus persepolensis]|uniref:transposase family protein n=1 Tax=Alteribacillus persepolensis TaxID=568899 RepID=UPI000B816D4F